MKFNKYWQGRLFSLLVLILICIVMFFSTGCEVLKHKQSSSGDTTAVHKNEMADVHKSTNDKESESEWWKETLIYGQHKDTVEKYLQPINNYLPAQPTMIIREGGKQKEESHSMNYDSMFRAQMDSMQAKFLKSSSSKETQVLSFWQLIGIACSGAVLMFILQKFGKIKIGLKP